MTFRVQDRFGSGCGQKGLPNTRGPFNQVFLKKRQDGISRMEIHKKFRLQGQQIRVM